MTAVKPPRAELGKLEQEREVSKFVIAAILSVVCVSAFARSQPPVAAVKSSTIPAAVMQGGTVQCTFTGPNGTHSELAFNNYCWDGYVYQGGLYTIKAQNYTTGVEASGSDYVPGGECTSGTPPYCTIQLGEPVFPPQVSE